MLMSKLMFKWVPLDPLACKTYWNLCRQKNPLHICYELICKYHICIGRCFKMDLDIFSLKICYTTRFFIQLCIQKKKSFGISPVKIMFVALGTETVTFVSQTFCLFYHDLWLVENCNTSFKWWRDNTWVAPS